MIGLGLFAVVVGLELFSIWISLRLIAWNADFYNALEDYDVSTAIHQIGVFFSLIMLSAVCYLIANYLRKYVLIRWRTRLTNVAIDKWLSGHAYWQLRKGLSPTPLENPDQRIAEDCRLFVSGLLNETIGLFTRIVGLFSYVSLLWSLSTFALPIRLGTFSLDIPHYLVWASFIYVFISSIMTHMLGWPLKNILFQQEKREADFRYSLMQLRDNASEVAMIGGEPAEKRRFTRRYAGVVENWHQLIRRELIVGLFTRPYFQTVLRIPLFLSLPAYLAGRVTLGGLMQLSSAFSNVTTTLSWFIFSYRSLADFVAISERLGGLLSTLDNPTLLPDVPAAITCTPSADGKLRLSDVSLVTPQGRPLLPVGEICIEPGQRVWIMGASGAGKSTLLKAISGLWPYGHGAIAVPNAHIAFMPQASYLGCDGLAEALTYPLPPESFDREMLKATLADVGLEHRAPSLDVDDRSALEGLSGGERQRLCFARLLLTRPEWIVLDEPTSALDRQAEAAMFTLLAERLPNSTILCVAHRPPEGLSIDVTLTITEPAVAA